MSSIASIVREYIEPLRENTYQCDGGDRDFAVVTEEAYKSPQKVYGSDAPPLTLKNVKIIAQNGVKFGVLSDQAIQIHDHM